MLPGSDVAATPLAMRRGVACVCERGKRVLAVNRHCDNDDDNNEDGGGGNGGWKYLEIVAVIVLFVSLPMALVLGGRHGCEGAAPHAGQNLHEA